MRPQQSAAEQTLAWYSAAVDYLLHSLAIMVVAVVGALGLDAWDRYMDWLDRRR